MRGDISDIVPLIFSQQQAQIKELNGKDLSVIRDGTACLGEAMAIVRLISSDWQIQQQHIRFQLIAQSMSGEQVARES